MNSTSRKTELASRLRALRQHLGMALRRTWGAEASELAAVMGPDGGPLGSHPEVARALWTVAEGWAAGGPRTPVEEGAFLAGVDALWRLAGDPGTLPADEVDLVYRLRTWVVGWNLDTAETRPMAGKTWACWAFRDTGLAVGHMRFGSNPGRLYLDARTGWLQWDVGGLRVLEGGTPTAQGALAMARVDGRKMRLVAEGPIWRRDVLAQGQRVVVRDRGGAVRWRIPAALEAREGGFVGQIGRFGVELKGEWVQDGEWLLARAREEETTLSVELRQL